MSGDAYIILNMPSDIKFSDCFIFFMLDRKEE